MASFRGHPELVRAKKHGDPPVDPGKLRALATRRLPMIRPKKRNVVTLADLAPRHEIKGGSQQRVFGADSIQNRRNVMPTKPIKDLPPKSTSNIKGGKRID